MPEGILGDVRVDLGRRHKSYSTAAAWAGGSARERGPSFEYPLAMATAGSLEDRALATWTKRRLLPRDAAKAFLAATEGLALAAVFALNRLREQGRAGASLTQLRSPGRPARSRRCSAAHRRAHGSALAHSAR